MLYYALSVFFFILTVCIVEKVCNCFLQIANYLLTLKKTLFSFTCTIVFLA